MQNVAIAPDLKHIVVTAGMVPNAADFLRTGTTFWIVKPRIGVGGVSGLGTLLSGAYIGLAPGEGEAARDVHRPGGAAADQRQRARPRVRPDRAEPGLGQPRRADLLPRHRYRPGSRLQAQRRRARPRHHDLRQGAVPRPGAHHEPVLERERHRPRHRRLRHRGPGRLAPGAADRRDRGRHARRCREGRGRGRRRALSALCEPARVGPGAVH